MFTVHPEFKLSVTVGSLFAHLRDDLLQINLQQENQEIHHIRLLTKEQKHFDSNTLYVGQTSDLDLTNPPLPNFLGTKNCSTPTEQLPDHLLNYALVDNHSSLPQIFNKAQDVLNQEQDFMQSSAVLLHCLIKNKGLQYIIDTCYHLLNNPMLLVDSSYKLLAYSKKDRVDDLVWNELMTKGYCSYDLISIFKKEGVVKMIADSRGPLLTDSGFSEKIRRIHGKIIVNDKLVAYLGVLEHNQKFKKEDYALIQLICDVISEEMKRNKTYYYLKGLLHENLLIDLLDGAIAQSHLPDRLKTAELKLDGALYLLVFNFGSKDPANYHLVDHLRENIDSIFTSSWSVFYHDQIVSVLSLKDELQLEAKTPELKLFLEENRLKAGISAQFKDITNIQTAYCQAQKALELGNLLLNSQILFPYPYFQIYHLLSLITDRHQLKALLHPAPQKLKDFDALNETDLFSTLYTYIAMNKNTMLSADKLFIHRNTMYYRLRKIVELTALDFNDYEECVQVYLTYKLLELSGCFPDQQSPG